MAYFDTKSGSLEEAIRQAVGGQKIEEKVEYVEYKFKSERDARAAKKMLDAVQLMDFDINDDDISNGELVVAGGTDGDEDFTKYHKEILKKFRQVKVLVQEKMDAVNKTAVKKKFDDRKDKDIDNDGDVDSSDKFLHKRRKAISKAVSKDEGNKFGKELKAARDKGEKTFVVSGRTYKVEDYNQDEAYGSLVAYKPVKSNHYDVKIQGVKKKDVNAILKYIKVDGGNYDIEDVDADQVTGSGMSSTSDGDIFIQGDDAGKLGMEIAKKFRSVKVMGENFEVGTKERRDHTLNTTPGQSPEEFDQQVGVMHAKNNYMREALAKMWGMKEGNNPFKGKKEEKKVKVEKTVTGKKATEIKVDPDLEENKNK